MGRNVRLYSFFEVNGKGDGFFLVDLVEKLGYVIFEELDVGAFSYFNYCIADVLIEFVSAFFSV